jgi:ABC-type Fe3+-hydroxamate transport system substrate-binding protein
MKIFLVLLLAGLVFAGCATAPKIDWASRVGHYTYDQAVLELGPPDKVAKLDSGIIVANWITRQGYAYSSVGAPVYGYYPGGPIAPNTTQGYSPAWFLRLTFGADGKLTEWKNYAQ